MEENSFHELDIVIALSECCAVSVVHSLVTLVMLLSKQTATVCSAKTKLPGQVAGRDCPGRFGTVWNYVKAQQLLAQYQTEKRIAVVDELI